MLPFLPASSGTSSNAEMCHCVHVSMCMSVTVQVLVNERQTEWRAQQRTKGGYEKRQMINLVCIE